MKSEAQRIAIAEACGWTGFGRVNASSIGGRKTLNGCPPNNKDCFTELPNYLSDLNAMHEAEKVLTTDQLQHYQLTILPKVCGLIQKAVTATAAQRAEAFLRTLDDDKRATIVQESS